MSAPALLVAGAAGVLAGMLNVMAGGGSLLTLPILIFLGLPAPVANGTNRLGILVQNTVATIRFRRSGYRDVRAGVYLALATLPGAVAGAYLSIDVPEQWFRRILAIIIVAGVAAMLFPPRVRGSGPPRRAGVGIYLVFLGIGFYGGFIQAGVGMIFLFVLHQLMHLDLVRVNAWKVLIVGIYIIPAFGVFVLTDHVDWVTGAALAAGTGAGGWLGARLTVRGGERWIRGVVVSVLLAMAVRLVLS